MRRIIRCSEHSGPVAGLGRFLGQKIGWRLNCGYRVIIDRPSEFIQDHLLNNGEYEPAIVNLIRQTLRPEDLFIDVGANMGCHTLVAASLGARVHSFEPAPHLQARLTKHVEINRLKEVVSIVAAALGSEIGQATLHVAERDDDGSHSLISGIPASSVERVIVPVTTLDAHIKDTNCGPPRLIKIDVEGYEARVLDGAVNLTRSTPAPIFIIETGDQMASKISESARSVLRRLSDLDYRIFRIEKDFSCSPVATEEASGELNNYCAIRSDHEFFALIRQQIMSQNTPAAR